MSESDAAEMLELWKERKNAAHKTHTQLETQVAQTGCRKSCVDRFAGSRRAAKYSEVATNAKQAFAPLLADAAIRHKARVQKELQTIVQTGIRGRRDG